LKIEAKHQNEVVKQEQTTYQQIDSVTIKQIEGVIVEQFANQ
jgi:hypothetical protein